MVNETERFLQVQGYQKSGIYIYFPKAGLAEQLKQIF